MDDIGSRYNNLRQQFGAIFLQILEQDDVANISDEVAQIASEKIGKDPNYYHILFPQGMSDIITYLSDFLDQKMLDKFDQEYKNIPSIRGKIKACIYYRIVQSLPSKAHYKILAYLNYHNLALKFKIIGKTCDIIWRCAGDQSTDFNYYTKRALLIGVYCRILKKYQNDNSPEFTDTSDFIQENLDKVVNMAKFKKYLTLPSKEDIPILRMFL